MPQTQGFRQTFLFHIGLPKTGSTSIQHGLVALTDELYERGIRVPYDRALYADGFPNRAAAKGAPQTDGYAYFFNVEKRRLDSSVDWPGAVEAFLNDDAAQTFVVSHENMSQSGAKLRGGRLSGLASQADVRFLVYLRAPLSYINSYCLQLVYGLGNSAPRRSMQPVTRYLRQGYAGLLTPFERFGAIDARNFDHLRKEGRLLPDFFSALGVEGLADDLGDEIAGLERQNSSWHPGMNLSCMFMALKQAGKPSVEAWFELRKVLMQAGADLEPPMQTSFLNASLVGKINTRWEQDREVLLQRYGVQLDEAPELAPGPEVLSFSAEYGAALQEAAGPNLSESQQDWLAQARELAGQDLEDVLGALRRRRAEQRKARAKKARPPVISAKGDDIMTDETETKPEFSHEDTMALARAMFRIQNKQGDADSDDDKTSFQDVKGDMMRMARRTLKILKGQGYSLTKAAD